MDAADMAWEPQAKSIDTRVASIVQQQQAEGTAVCDECGNAIPAARRNAYPSARHCISCQEEVELKMRHLRRA